MCRTDKLWQWRVDSVEGQVQLGERVTVIDKVVIHCPTEKVVANPQSGKLGQIVQTGRWPTEYLKSQEEKDIIRLSEKLPQGDRQE